MMKVKEIIVELKATEAKIKIQKNHLCKKEVTLSVDRLKVDENRIVENYQET